MAGNPSSDCEGQTGDECAARVIRGPIPGLGQVNGRYDVVMALDFDAAVRRVREVDARVERDVRPHADTEAEPTSTRSHEHEQRTPPRLALRVSRRA